MPVDEAWKEKPTLKQAIQVAQANRTRFIRVLKQIDTEHTGHCSFSLFLQSSIDQSIGFDEETIKYIIERRCDRGELNYVQLVADMILRTYIDCTGSILLQWHVRQALATQTFPEKSTMWIQPCPYQNIQPSDARSVNSHFSKSTASTQKTSSEVGEALKKVKDQKKYEAGIQKQLISLNQVSAASPILQLRKNEQHDIYLKAN